MAINASTMLGMTKKATAKWTKQRKAEERSVSAYLNRSYALSMNTRDTIKDAAYAYMETAYNKVSDNGRLPAMARQIMYASRGYILGNSDCENLKGDYFRDLLKDFIAEHPSLTSGWNVAFDARGNYNEPHTDKHVPIGTLPVKKYVSDVMLSKTKAAMRVEKGKPPQGVVGQIPDFADKQYPTTGPDNRFSAILFVEKEGFMPLFEEVKLAERYDLALMSTKGMSVIAARILVDNLCSGVPLLVVRDFDKAGFSIASTIQKSSKHYRFENAIDVIDFGLRLEDAKGLESEDVFVNGSARKAVRNLRNNGATEEEIEFLLPEDKRTYKGTWGKRIELNAFTSPEIIEWLEEKLEEHGIEKVVPEGEVLDEAFRRAYELRCYQNLIKKHSRKFVKAAEALDVPDDLEEQIQSELDDHPDWMWDQALNRIMKKQVKPAKK